MRLITVPRALMVLLSLVLFSMALNACAPTTSATGKIPATTTSAHSVTATGAATMPATQAPTATSLPSCSAVSSGAKPLSTSTGPVTFDFVSGLIASGSAPQVSISVASGVVTVTGVNGIKLAAVATILTCQQLHQVQFTDPAVSGVANSAILIALQTQQHDLVFALITPQTGGDIAVQWSTYTP